MNNSASRLITL